MDETDAPVVTRAMLAEELVCTYDVLRIAVRLAVRYLTASPAPVWDQAQFWGALTHLDDLVCKGELRAWIADDWEQNDPPTDDRRLELEHLRRAWVDRPDAP